MKFKNEQNEIFWRNVSEKHKLNQSENRVLMRFVIDAPTFELILSYFSKQLDMKPAHVSRAFKSLVGLGILIPNLSGSKYDVNPLILTKNYEPQYISSTNSRKDIELQYKTGSGNWIKQQETKIENQNQAISNIKKMVKKTREKISQTKSPVKTQESNNSEIMSPEIKQQISSTLHSNISEEELENYNFKGLKIGKEDYLLNENRKVRKSDGKKITIPTLNNTLKYLQLNKIKPIHWIIFLDAQIEAEFISLIESHKSPPEPLKLIKEESQSVVEDITSNDPELDELFKKAGIN